MNERLRLTVSYEEPDEDAAVDRGDHVGVIVSA
jgi:hypothetical protein